MRSDGPALLPVFRSQHQAELLMWLLLHPEEEFTMSDLAGRLGAPLSTLHREVARLEAAGLIRSRALGRNRMLRANTAHRASGPLTQLLEISFGPRVVIAEEFAVEGAQQVIIFGSWAARYAGEAGPPPTTSTFSWSAKWTGPTSTTPRTVPRPGSDSRSTRWFDRLPSGLMALIRW